MEKARANCAPPTAAAPSDAQADDGPKEEDDASEQKKRSSLRKRSLTLSFPITHSCLNAIKKELAVPRRGRNTRKPIFCNTSPTLSRCHSPMSAVSPLDSPRNMSPSQHFAFIPAKRGSAADNRRRSVGSLPSSGYGTNGSSVSSQCSSQEKLHSSQQVTPSNENYHRHFGSNESNPGIDGDDVHRSPMGRPRSRSLSPLRSPGMDNDVVVMNNVYKEQFPKATKQMEEKLAKFVTEYGDKVPDGDGELSSDVVARFAHHQVVQMARDCLQQSRAQLLSTPYFFEISQNLEKLLEECKEKSPNAAAYLKKLIKSLLLIISRPARLLECLEFDPEEFYRLLEAAEGQVKGTQGITTDIPQYIISKLGLTRDPLEEFNTDNFGPEDSLSEDFKVPKHQHSKIKQPQESDFETIKLISNGAYGAVYLVRHKETRQRLALKKINKHNLVLRNQLEQIYAERDIMGFSDNPFVVSMVCSFETKRHLCLVMEYVEGGDCASLLKNMGPLPLDLARFYFAETVLAAEYLHSYGIVHRDLKPDNLLITSMGHIKLTDFGLSKVGLMNMATTLYEGYMDRETKQFTDKQVYGTPEYIAPEVILRQGYGKPVDWWSMGIILYEFLIGCVPFFGDTPEELFAHVINDEIEWPEDEDIFIPEEARYLITGLLQQTPMDRLGTGGAHEVKEHPFFAPIDWNSLLRQKAEFVPQLENEEDTSYFDTRADRYCHEVDSEELDDTDDTTLLSSFSSCSPRYRKVYSRIEKELEEEHLMKKGSREEHRKVTSKLEIEHSSSEGRMGSLNETPEHTADSSQNDSSGSRKGSKESTTTHSTPESSQTESEEVSPQIQRRWRPAKDVLPRFSISMEEEQRLSNAEYKELSPVDERIPPPSPKQRAVIKSASASGLSLMIPADVASPGGSSTSSRDTSPSRELSPLAINLKPPIIIQRGPRGFGFTIRAIRVYFGDSDIYTVHHLVLAVENNSPAFEAGLRPGDLITHINGEPVTGLVHHQVLQLILSGGDRVNIRTTPLESTTIKTGGRKRNPHTIKMARRPVSYRRRCPGKRADSDKKRRTSLLRRLSSKRASVEMQQVVGSPTVLTPSRSFQSLNRCLISGELVSPTPESSQSSSPSSSVPNSPSTHHFPRPSSLHGLKHKLTQQSFHSPRRKSVGHIPLSPLARTPSPSPMVAPPPTSPTRSPSPLAFPNVHGGKAPASPLSSALCSSAAKRSFMRPKSAEPGSPLLRRALSPDRLHPKSAESKVKHRESFSGASPLALSSSPQTSTPCCVAQKGTRTVTRLDSTFSELSLKDTPTFTTTKNITLSRSLPTPRRVFECSSLAESSADKSKLSTSTKEYSPPIVEGIISPALSKVDAATLVPNLQRSSSLPQTTHLGSAAAATSEAKSLKRTPTRKDNEKS